MSLLPYPRLTPWVLRLLVINAVVLAWPPGTIDSRRTVLKPSEAA